MVGDDYSVPRDGGVGDIRLPRGCLVRYREWYGASAPQVGLKLTAEEVAEGIRNREKDEQIAYGVLDPAAFSVDGGPSIAERMARVGVHFRRADNKRVGVRGSLSGWDQMRSRLAGDADGNPMLVVFSTCKDFIRTVPALQHDPDRPEDVDTEGEDHVGDEARYACMSRPYIPRSRETLPPAEPYYVSPGNGQTQVQLDFGRYLEKKAAAQRRYGRR